jgi:hypothetical protein
MIEKYLSQMQRGIVYMALGFVLLFHTLGIITTGLNIILVLISLLMIVIGFIRANLWEKCVALYQKLAKKK